MDETGYDHINDILNDEGYSFLMISTHIEKANRDALLLADELAAWCLAAGHSFYFMCSSVDGEILRVRQELDLGFDVFTTDEITLKTIVRSNPGLVLLKDGTVLGKWHYNDMPGPPEFQTGILNYSLSHYRKTLEKRSLGMFVLIFLILSILIMYSPLGRSHKK